MSSPSLSAEILHEALRQAHGVIIITDAEMNIIYVSRVTMGYKIEDVIGRRHGAFVSPEQRRKLDLVFEQARATGQAQHYETFLDAPDGQRHYYSNQISSYETEDGAGYGMISILTEVTRQRSAEASIEGLRRELMEASHRAGMAEIATGVLHHIGNVLNSVTVSSEALSTTLRDSRLHLLERTVAMLDEHQDRLDLLMADPKGRKLPALLSTLGRELAAEQDRLRTELSRLREHVGRIRAIVAAQHGLARLGEMAKPTEPDQLVHQALSMFRLDLERHVIELELTLDDVGTVVLDQQATLQVLVNLIRNAIEALELVERRRRLSIRLHVNDHELHFDVEDNGCGISPEDLGRLFQHGFSTKPSGHGFGLHTSNIAARTMNGTLQAHSDGLGRGARLRLVLPRILP